MSESLSATLQKNVADAIFLSQQLDLLHLSLTNLFDMIDENEIEIILEQPDKSAKQKLLFISKVIDQLPSPELAAALTKASKAASLDFFRKNEILDFLNQLQQKAESITVVRLTVAIQFKDADLKDLSLLFAKRIGTPVAFEIAVQPDLIGGAIIQYGTYIYDYSIKTRFEQFKEQWQEARLA